jgi:hypothetical protein
MKKIIYCLLPLIFLVTSCRTSYITNSWKYAGATAKKYNKVMVLAMTREEDRAMQEKMEKHMIGDLQVMGYNAVSSLDEYGPRAFRNMTEEQAVEKIKSDGIDAVITIVLLNIEKETRYYPGHPRYASSDYYHQDFTRYFRAMRDRIYDFGYYVSNTRYSWESNLYDLSDRNLLYSVQTDSFDPVSAENMGHEYGKMVIKNMAKAKLLEKQPPLKAF